MTTTVKECYRHLDIGPPHWDKAYVHLTQEQRKAIYDFIYGYPMEAFQNIFKKTKRSTNSAFTFDLVPDPRRKQRVLEKEEIDTNLRPVLKAIETSLQRIAPSLVPCHPAILLSLPNGPNQEEHPDFSRWTFPRFAAIFSVDDSTKLRIRNIDGVYETIPILKNELLVFRGDVMHGGASYVTENRRLYLKVLPAGCQLDKDELEAVGAEEKKCKHCGETYECTFEWHRRVYCRAKNTKRETAKKKAGNRKRAAEWRKNNKNE